MTADELTQAIERSGLAIPEIARRLGVAPSTVNRWANGSSGIKAATERRLREMFRRQLVDDVALDAMSIGGLADELDAVTREIVKRLRRLDQGVAGPFDDADERVRATADDRMQQR